MQNYKTSLPGNFRNGKIRFVVLAVFVCILLGNRPSGHAADEDYLPKGNAALRSGDYAKAAQMFEMALKNGEDTEQSQSGLLEVLRITGDYKGAVKHFEEFFSGRADYALLLLEGGRIYQAVGNYTKAEESLKLCINIASNQFTVRLEAMRDLADLLSDIGRETEAKRWWNSLIDEYRLGVIRGSDPLGAVAVAAWRLDYINDARDIFLDATNPDLGEVSLSSLTDFGNLFLEKYNATEAMESFKDCLEINPSYPEALVGMARAKIYESDMQVEVYSRSALNINPNLVAARNLLAGLALDAEYYEAALDEIEAALAVNPANLESLSLLAVYHYLHDNNAAFQETEKKILSIHPTYGRFYYNLAENLASRRKYQEAVNFSRKAIALDPDLWSAYMTLGMNLTRVGDLEGGREAMEQAFEGDPYNIWASNSLDLLDQMDTFVSSKSEHFHYRMSREDGRVLAPYAGMLAEEAYANLTERYGFEPQGPLFIEIFPDHGGFAVRTLGLPGLEGALGVCFGKVIAMDSPRARKAGTYNWGTALWHEFAHVITLQMTNHNIPRWFSEGLSVFEEHKARPGWGDGINPSFVKAYKEGKLLKASELNKGFTRPESIEQVLLSYVQASLVCEWMEKAYGFDSIRKSLLLFAENKPSEEVFLETLGLDTAGMDSQYAHYIDSLVKDIASGVDFEFRNHLQSAESKKELLAQRLKNNPDDFFANLQMGAILLDEEAPEQAEVHLKKAQQLFPDYVEHGNPYQLLAELYLETGRENEALTQLEEWIRNDGDSREPLIKAAAIYDTRKDYPSLARVLDRAIYIHPYDVEDQEKLGKASLESGKWDEAIAAYRALVELNATDPAQAHLDLATALLASGNKEEAKRETLRSLEIAPSFLKAQQLLLRLSGE
ncbi:MAG: tetratricopeptide repeat protein [Acidobacteriota bacterium]